MSNIIKLKTRCVSSVPIKRPCSDPNCETNEAMVVSIKWCEDKQTENLHYHAELQRIKRMTLFERIFKWRSGI